MALNRAYKFINPIRRGSGLLEEITVRPPALRDLKALDRVSGGFARAAKMIELLTGLSESEVDGISLEDMRGLEETIRPFFTDLRRATTS
ncbi:MAG TPA: phage tail assembly protein [Alphaproteobacteria bacterium]|nr:phage tail assembly protein [Alphaproteobacteria bacterium]